MSTPSSFIGRRGDFDFLVGHWHIANRRLKQRHVGCTEWDEFEATSEAHSLLDGIVSVDENRFPSRGFSGCTVRTLDLAQQQWSIYWINSQVGTLFPPVVGGWSGDRGEFRGVDDDDGRPVQVCFVWQRLGPNAARWEQSFSLDGGSWEINWVMEMTRRSSRDAS